MTWITLRPPTMAARAVPRHPHWSADDRWSAERRRILERLRARGARTVPELVGGWALAPALVEMWFARLERDGLVWRTPGAGPGMLPRYGLTFAARRVLRRAGGRRRRWSTARDHVAYG